MSTAELKAWADNPRKNDGRPVEEVKRSIKRFGFGAPIIARQQDGEIIAGHTRLKAAVLKFDRPKRSAEHPTMKPVALVEYCLRNSTKPGWIVGDPFGGSGTTMLAAERVGCAARLIEISPHYCDVIRRRWTKWARDNNREVGSGGLEEG